MCFMFSSYHRAMDVTVNDFSYIILFLVNELSNVVRIITCLFMIVTSQYCMANHNRWHVETALSCTNVWRLLLGLS